MGARIRDAALGIALVLALCFGCTGCFLFDLGGSESASQSAVDMSDEITKRDITTAYRIGATEEIISSLKNGEWHSYSVKLGIREAEAAEDHLGERYGVEFQACKVMQSDGFMPTTDEVTLRITSGPFDGEKCTCTFYPTGNPKTGEIEWADNYIYVRLHEEYESNVQAAAEEAFGDLPEGTWVCDIAMDSDPYPEDVDPDASLAEAGPYLDGHIWLDISPESTITEEEYQARVERMKASLEDHDISIFWETIKVTKPLDGAEFTMDWATDAIRSGYEDWRLSGHTSAGSGNSW
jgi:hypothetical protein